MANLYEFQKDAVAHLLAGRHFIISGVGCLAGDVPIPLAYGGYRLVSELKRNDVVMSYDECKQEFVAGTVDCVIRTCHKPKPMIRLEYDGEQITTTYDHPFFNGEGYYPLYQLIWGALETSQRVQLKLLCEQYGQAFDDKAIWCKHCGSNEPCEGRQWLLQDDDGWQDCQASSHSGGKLAEKPYQLGMCEPFELQQGRQQSRESRVVFKEIQCLVGGQDGSDKSARMEGEEGGKTDEQRERKNKNVLRGKNKTFKNKQGQEESLRQVAENVPRCLEGHPSRCRVFERIEVKAAEPYYTICMREAPYTYCIGRKHYFITHNSGKTAMALTWAAEQCRRTGKHKVLVVTTASKVRTGDFEKEDKIWNDDSEEREMVVISWHKLKAWVEQNWKGLEEWVVIADECLPADTKVKTENGEKEIIDLSVGDKVLSYNHDTRALEYKKVTRTVKKASPSKMVRLLLSNGTAIISTGNHPHFTQSGYKNAEDIKEGDLLYEDTRMEDSKVREKCEVWHLRKRNTYRKYYLQPERPTSYRKKDLLFSRMHEEGEKREWEKDNGESRVQGKAKKNKYRAYEHGQPVLKRRRQRKGTGNEEAKRLATYMDKETGIKGRKRNVFNATNNVVEGTVQAMQGLGNGTDGNTRAENPGLPDLLQVRHRQCIFQNRDRMRRAEPSLKQDKVERQKERGEIRGIRVEGIEVLELGDIRKLGLYRDPDNVYCIDVEDNHNFFANGILTHNCQRSKGYSTGMGKAFLKITKQNPDWAGFTGTPGDTWADYISYFVATNQTRNKTAYLHEFANVQTYKGYPEIVGWRNEDKLKAMWARISYAPDTSIVAQEMPKEQYRTITLPKPRAYSKVLKTRLNEQGEFLDTAGAMVAELRRLCFTKDKQQWVADFVESVESGAVMFYNYIATGDKLTEICGKALGKSGRVWRIDGKHHEIPTAETIGAKDVVLCQWQSGSEALNLQFLHYWVGVELCYSNSMLQQAMGRIRRIGQEHPMSFYRLLTDGTIEQDIAEALKSKKIFAEKVWCASNNIETKEEKK